MPPQRRKVGLEFFRRFPDPASWGLRPYLKAKHGDMTFQHVLDNWRKSLITILQSTGTDFTEAQRVRAAELLECYKQNVKPFPSFAGDGAATATGVVTGLVPTLHCTLPRRIPLQTAPVGLFALWSSLQLMVPFGREKAIRLFYISGVWLSQLTLEESMRLVFDYCC